MKNFRRILALIVTLTMLFSMTAPAISEGVVDPTPVETPVEEKKDETPVEEKKDETPAAPAEEKGETPAAPAEEKGETPAAPAEETKDEAPAAPAEETKDETPAAPAEEKKGETPAAPAEEKGETPAAPAEETKDEAPAEETKDETPVAPAEETAPASTGETAEQAPAQEPVPAAGNREETQEAPAPAQTEEAQPVAQETAPAAAAAAAQTEEEPAPVQEETTEGVEPAMEGEDDPNAVHVTITNLNIKVSSSGTATKTYNGQEQGAPDITWEPETVTHNEDVNHDGTDEQFTFNIRVTTTGKKYVTGAEGYTYTADDFVVTLEQSNNGMNGVPTVQNKTVEGTYTLVIEPMEVTVEPKKDVHKAYTGAAEVISGAEYFNVTSPVNLDPTLKDELLPQLHWVADAKNENYAANEDGYPFVLCMENGTVRSIPSNVGNFRVTSSSGDKKFYIDPLPITITAGSANKIYDGTALTCTDYTTIPATIPGTGITSVTMTDASKITDVEMDGGSVVGVDNVIGSVNGTAITGQEQVIGNYKVSTENGKLTINPREVTLTAEAVQHIYRADHNYYSIEGSYKVADPGETTGLVGTDKVPANYIVRAKDFVATTAKAGNSFDLEFFDKNANSVLTGSVTPEGSNYKYNFVVPDDAKYSITAKEVTVTLTDAANELKSFYGEAIDTTTFETAFTYNPELTDEDQDELNAKVERVISPEDSSEGKNAGVYSYQLVCGTTTITANSADGTPVGDNFIVKFVDNGYKYEIKKLPVTLSLAGKPEKIYGESDPDFSPFTVASYTDPAYNPENSAAVNIKTPDVIIEELGGTGEGGILVSRVDADDNEDVGTYGYTKESFQIGNYDNSKDNYTITIADTVAEEGFKFTIKPLPVTLSLAGSPTKVYSDLDPDFTEYLVASYTDAEYKTENSKTPSSTEPDAKVSPILTELGPIEVTRLEEEGSENAGTYLYEKFTITPTENPNYEVTIAPAANVDKETFSFTISQLTVYLTLEGHPWKYYSVTDAKADYEDFTEFVKIELPETEQDENGEFHYLGEIKPSDVEKVIAPVATRPGAAKDKVTNEAKEQVGTYGYEDFDITFTEDDNFFVQTIHQLKEQEAEDELEIEMIEDPDFEFKIDPLEVTLTLDGKPEKDYGVTDEDAGVDFNDFLTATFTAASSKTPKEMVSELKATVTRADAGKLSDEKVGVYEYSKAKFPIDPNPTENNNYKVTVAEKADKFAFTIKPNITIGEMKWTEGNVTTRTGNTIKASFTVPSGKPDVTLDVPMTVTVKLDLSGTNTYLTDEAKAALSALELTGTFTGKNGEIEIPAPDALENYLQNNSWTGYAKDSCVWHGGLPAGTKLVVTGVQLGDDDGTVNGAAPSVPVAGFEVAKHEVTLTMAVEAEGKTMYKLGENSYVVGPEATVTLSHDSPLDEYVILTSNAAEAKPKPVLVPAGGSVSIKASEMNAGDYEVLGLTVCEDGLYKADSTVLTSITAAMVDDAHLTANTEAGEFVLDNIANKNVKAQFENRGNTITVTLPEATQPGSPVTVTVNGMTIPAQTADGTTVTFDVFGIWSANPQNLIRSGEGIGVIYTDAVGNLLSTPAPAGSVTKSAGNKITINMRTIDDDDVGSVGGDGKVRIYGEASNYEKVIISVNGTTVAIVDVTGSGNYDPSKSGQWSYVLNLADLDLSTGRVTITAVYDDLTGGDERTFNYKGEVMPVLLTSPLLEQFDKIYGFAEYGTTVHVTINGEDYNTDDNPEMFLTDDAGNTVSVYEHFPSEHDSYFYWIFQCPSRMKPDDDIQIWYEDFTGENVTPEDKRGVQVQAVSDTDAKFDNTAEVLGANVIDYLYMDKDKDGKDIPGTGEMGHNFVTPVDLNKIKEEPLTLPVLAFDGYKVGQVTFSMDDAGQLVVTPEIADDSEGAVKWGVSLFGEKPSIQALRANACGDDLAEKTFNVNGFGDKVWVSARFDVDLSYMRIGGMQDFCALAPHDSSSNNRLQSYAANLGDDNYKFYSESLSEPVIEPEVTED